MAYDYDNCCNPTAPGLISCLDEACSSRTSCANGGLYDEDLCVCLCIPPFSVDGEGDCTAVGESWMESPFKECDVNDNDDCPWWSDPLRLEHCDSGSEIPEGVSVVDWTREECCERHYPGSKFCNGNGSSAAAVGGGGSGSASDDNLDLSMFEVIPVKFSISNLPDEIDIPNLKEQVRTALKDFLLELAIRFTGAADLGVSSVKETTRFWGFEGEMNQVGGMDVYYDVRVIREPEQEFGPTIIEEVIDSYEDIVKDIQDKVPTEIYVNICAQGGEGGLANNNPTSSPMGSLFNRCSLQSEEVTTTFRFKDLPQEITNNTASFDDIKMVIMEAYKEILTGGGDGSIGGLMLLSIADKEEVPLDDGIIDAYFNIVFVGGSSGVAYATAIEDKIARSRDVVENRLQSYTDESTDWNVRWCTKEEGTLTVCAPGEKALSGGVDGGVDGGENASETKSVPVWGYIVIASVGGVMGLACICCWCKCEGSCCARRAVSRGRPSRKAEKMNRLNMTSYIASGRQAEKRSSKKKRKKSSFARVDHDRRDHDRRSKSRRSRSSGERHGRRRRPDNERRHHSSSHSRRHKRQSQHRSRKIQNDSDDSSDEWDRRQSQRRSSSRKRSRRIHSDSDDFSISSFDPEKQEDEIVMYEGEQSQQLVICDDDDEERQVERAAIMNTQPKPDPDGSVLMLTGPKPTQDNNQVLIEEDGERLVTFRV